MKQATQIHMPSSQINKTIQIQKHHLNQKPISKAIQKINSFSKQQENSPKFKLFAKKEQLEDHNEFLNQKSDKQLEVTILKNSIKKQKLKTKNLQKQQIILTEEIEKCKQVTGQSQQLNNLSSLKQQEAQLVTPKKIIKRSSIKSKSRKSKSFYKFDKNNEQQIETFKFPFTNEYIEKHSQQFLSTEDAIQKAKNQLRDPQAVGTYLNCDVRYFNWEHFIQQVGKFDVLIIDPPWRIKGAQQNDSQFMFSNCKFSLQYNTMGNSQISRIPLQLISDEGFIFIWILNSQLDTSIEIMQTWGYQLVDQITWVKLRDSKIYLTHGYYFMHSYQLCLVGYKNNKKNNEQKLKIRGPVSNNTLFAQVKKKSQKPQDLYIIIQMMFSSKKKIQIFARNHNLRFGIFSIGNQLGQSYQKWNIHLDCDKCKNPIQFGTKRFKSKRSPNYDLCHKCVTEEQKIQFFEISNEVDQDIRHQYVACNHCKTSPIWGIRFQCITCHDFDICQGCYDKNLQLEQKFHSIDHQFRLMEMPVFGHGFQIHQVKCFSCYQNPIIGVYFNCTYCKNYKLCQKCFFERPKTDSNSRNHKPDHQMQVIFDPQIDMNKKYECFGCKIQIYENCQMCQNCYNFFFCQGCYQKRDSFKSLYANSHKKYHVFSKIF